MLHGWDRTIAGAFHSRDPKRASDPAVFLIVAEGVRPPTPRRDTAQAMSQEGAQPVALHSEGVKIADHSLPGARGARNRQAEGKTC